eukprot:1013692-Pyramimonas_sp.AAC.2
MRRGGLTTRRTGQTFGGLPDFPSTPSPLPLSCPPAPPPRGSRTSAGAQGGQQCTHNGQRSALATVNGQRP